jgi:hypothetical protein
MDEMASSLLTAGRRERRHGVVLQPTSRRALERSGWRTTLDFRENHVRGGDGRLLRVEGVWLAEAERYDGELSVASAEGSTADEAWDRLATAVDNSEVRTAHRVRVARVNR